MLKKLKLNWHYVLIFSLTAIAFAFLRFYLLDKRIIFDWDQEQFSNQIWDFIKDHKPTLLGPRVTDDKGFFLAPYFTYLLVPFYLLSRMHPIALVVFVGIVNVAFFICAWKIITKIFDQWIALGFLVLWTFNSMLMYYDGIPWWPILLPIGIVLSWWSLYRIYHTPSYKNYALLGLILGLFIHMHFQFVIDIFFAGVFLICSQQKKLIKQLPQIGVSVVIFLSFWLPLFLFDLRHEFLNTHLIVNYFAGNGGVVHADRWVWTAVFTNVVQPLTYIKSVQLMIVVYLLVLISTVFLFRKKSGFQKSFYLTTLIIWLLMPLIFAKYGRRPSEYYFLAIIPHMYLVITDILQSYAKKWSAVIVLAMAVYMIAFNWIDMKNLLRTNSIGLYHKDQIVQDLKRQVNNRTFNVSFDGPPNADTGFRYLIRWYDLKPDASQKVPLVQIVIPKTESGNYTYQYKILMPVELK